MPENTNSQKLDEILLRSKFTTFMVEFDPALCNHLLQTLSSTNPKRSLHVKASVIKPTLAIIGFLAILLTLVTLEQNGTLNLFSSPDSNFAPAQGNPISKMQLHPFVKIPVILSHTPVSSITAEIPDPNPESQNANKFQAPISNKSDSDVKIHATASNDSNKNLRVPENKTIVGKTDSSQNLKTQTAGQSEQNATSDSSVNKNPPPTKKKRKRKNRTSIILDSMKEANLQPSEQESEVVVPQ